MRFSLLTLVIAAASAFISSPALACLPPPSGTGEEARLDAMLERTTDVVYGVVVRGARGERNARFRVIHVYRGDYRPGDVIAAPASLGFDPPPCLDFTIAAAAPRANRGQYGVIGFDRRAPALHFIQPHTLEEMFDLGLLVRANPNEQSAVGN